MSIETWLSASRERLESPPLVQERQIIGGMTMKLVGITPARAGKTDPDYH